MAKWPDQIPGQILGVNVETGVGYIVDPLHDPANELLKAKVEKSLGKVPPAREDFRDIDMATWLHFIKKAVHSGNCATCAWQSSGTFFPASRGWTSLPRHASRWLTP